ncbi:TPA: restriction endonuclease subunit S [Escherichia coli]|uniref:restriction endonuclease subunit S n=2 Tax=Escherichia coli TaxID=562 RepID=UPI000B7FAEB5|nr:restriction endonuclease subunit S [Escherichia coli]HCA7282497.1 restriction endonuclease subunit S [Escherichia coli O157:H45]EHR9646125.1 restriction endonuclease subunit S [Escherichia coli]EJW8667533.1 restriction endonuclease subunit S [Escherichia coli]EKY6997997.1 restriction endonuclease subunit S [Escherichia coli]ELN3717259.1 restriction endonuclease subunit S [Escherichia coli]
MSVEKLIVDHMETWTSALQTRSTAGRGSSGKIDLYGIKKLRELILELAVRGKLVPQDPNDEPASELLKRIAAEKAELVKQGKIKKQKPLPEISEEEKPFELPQGWEWARLVEIYDVRDGTHDTPKYQSEGYPLVTSKNLSSGKLNLDDIKYISKEAHEKIKERSFVEFNDVLFAMIGSIGNPVIVDIHNEFSIKNVALFKYYSKAVSVPEYLRCVLESLSLVLKNISSGGVQPFVSLSTLRNTVMALPPLKEQYRIVIKLTALMYLCDQLEQQSLTTLDAHQQLVETLLGTLTDSQNAEELAENWARISEHFDTLFTTEASVDALKQTILQLAVMGKLVPQDPNDEPASELLKRIAQEKAQLVKEGKIKKQKPLPPISDEEKPFELPEGWEWCRLGDCINLISGQHLKPDEYSDEFNDHFLPYITGPAEFGIIHPTYSKYTNERRAIAEKGDILITCKGAGLGKLNIANTRIAISRQLMAIGAIGINSTYLKITLDSMYDYFQSKGVGIAIPGISREDVLEPTIMLPPVQEQINIIDQFMMINNILDCLKEKIKSAKQTQLHLADALTDAAIN